MGNVNAVWDLKERHMIVAWRKELKRLSALYYNSQPEMSDDEYDMRYRYLQRLEAKHPEMADPNSPTNTVGAPI